MIKRDRKIAVFLTGILLIGTLFAGCAINPRPESDTVSIDLGEYAANVHKITVSATGSTKVMPNVAYITVGVITQNKNMKEAQSENKERMNALFDEMKRSGLTDEDMRTTNYSAYPMYDYTDGNNEITGYEVTNTVELTVRNIDDVGELIDTASESGANTAYPVRFSLIDETAYYNEALADAMGKARGKADAIAEEGNYAIVSTCEVMESACGYVPYESKYLAIEEEAAYDGAATPITAGELDVSATITVVYEITP